MEAHWSWYGDAYYKRFLLSGNDRSQALWGPHFDESKWYHQTISYDATAQTLQWDIVEQAGSVPVSSLTLTGIDINAFNRFAMGYEGEDGVYGHDAIIYVDNVRLAAGAVGPTGDISMVSASTADSQSVTFTYNVVGTGMTPFQVGVYRSADAIYDAGDARQGTLQRITDVSPGVHTTTLDVSLTAAPGRPYVLVVADPNNSIPEATEGNNTASFADTDEDGLWDSWETTGIDVNGDGTIDLSLPALGADRRHKDIFVEVDAMIGRDPAQATLNRVVAAFAAAPNDLVHNPDGRDGITLHAVLDETNISRNQWTALDASGWPLGFDTTKQGHFGTQSDRDPNNSNGANVLRARRLVYRYCVFADSYGGTDSSGLAEIGGNDFMVTLGRWNTPGGTTDQQAGTFMHELGHTLGLLHGGDEDVNYKPNYTSIMSYTWQVPRSNYSDPTRTYRVGGTNYRGGWQVDYSRAPLPNLNEGNLDESRGIGGRTSVLVPIGPGQDIWTVSGANLVPEGGPVRWNTDNDTNDTGVVRNINDFAGSPSPANETLRGYEDWSNLDYDFRDSAQYIDGAHDVAELTEQELTYEINRMLERIPADGNTPPVAQDDTDVATYEGTSVVIELLLNDTDANGTLDATTVEVITEPANGAVTLNGDGTVTYAPAPGFHGLDTFTYEVKDDEGVRSNDATVSVAVVIPLQIEVKPGDSDPALNLASNGLIAVAVYTTAEFDARTIDAGTVVFAGAHAVKWSYSDVDSDGDLDLVLHFETQKTNLQAVYTDLLLEDFDLDGVLDSTRQHATVTLSGKTTDGLSVEGSDELDLFLSGKKLRELLDRLHAEGLL